MKKTRNVISILFLVLIVLWLTAMDWGDIISKTNRSALLGILTGVLMIAAMQLSNRKTNK